jgi:hypothetical protein
MHNIYDIAMKRYSLQNRVKITAKKFYEIDPWGKEREGKRKKYQFCPFSIIKLISREHIHNT